VDETTTNSIESWHKKCKYVEMRGVSNNRVDALLCYLADAIKRQQVEARTREMAVGRKGKAVKKHRKAQRAAAELDPGRVVQVDLGVYKYTSTQMTDGIEVVYGIVTGPDGRTRCTCPAFYRSPQALCKHVALVLNKYVVCLNALF
jgi:hypothetical protein